MLVINDDSLTLETLDMMLTRHGHMVQTAANGGQARRSLSSIQYDVVLLDLILPDDSGEHILRWARSEAPMNHDTSFIALTAYGNNMEAETLHAGADDFVSAPYHEQTLIARIRTQTERIRALRELAEQAQRLQLAFEAQSRELEQVRWLQRFLPASLVSSYLHDPRKLERHRRRIACLFFDLRSFTQFSSQAAPEDVEAVIGEYHTVLEPLIAKFAATVGGLAGDGVMLYLNDPEPCDRPAYQAVQLAIEVQHAMRPIVVGWQESSYDLGCGAGVAFGWATMADIGFNTRRDYTPLGPAVNLASRLCDAAVDGEILIDARARSELRGMIRTDLVSDRVLRGIDPREKVYRVVIDG